MTPNIRRLGLYLLISFFLVSVGLAYWQVAQAEALEARDDNPENILIRRTAIRGNIFDANGVRLAWSEPAGNYTSRVYADPEFTHVIGYSSILHGTTGVERAFDGFLTGQSDPNPFAEIADEILEREPQPHDLRLTIDQRLQDLAGSLLGGRAGSVVALDPQTGAILAMVSHPTFDAGPVSGNPATAQSALDAISAQPGAPLVHRAVDGRYVPGSIMKVVTAAAALEANAIDPDTTFPDQPREEVEGFPVGGFVIREHDLGGIQPQLWALSESLQVSSNIYFAHVGLELGRDRFIEYARRFGFCEPLRIGPADHPISVSPSLVTPDAEDGSPCRPFADDVELASTSFGQGSLEATPMQFALVAATIANEGFMPQPYVVSEVLEHGADGTPSEEVVGRPGGGPPRLVVSGATAEIVRAAMVDAVEGELGVHFAGPGDVDLYGMSGVTTAGKTGTAERGEGLEPHSWFIGFARAGEDDEPSIAVAVLVEAAGAGSTQAAPIGGQVMAEWLRLSADPAGE